MIEVVYHFELIKKVEL